MKKKSHLLRCAVTVHFFIINAPRFYASCKPNCVGIDYKKMCNALISTVGKIKKRCLTAGRLCHCLTGRSGTIAPKNSSKNTSTTKTKWLFNIMCIIRKRGSSPEAIAEPLGFFYNATLCYLASHRFFVNSIVGFGAVAFLCACPERINRLLRTKVL